MWKNQKKIVDQILDLYKKYGHVSVYIHGKPGTGKSQIATFVARHYGSTLTSAMAIFREQDNYRNDMSLAVMIKNLRPQENSPLIVFIDKIDKILINQMTTSYGKQQWNTFLDSSLMRPSRIDAIFELESEKSD